MDAKTTSERTVIAALPGWYVAAYYPAGEADGEKWDEGFHLKPIVAWAIEREEDPRVGSWHAVTPLTLDGDQTFETLWAVKSPDGRFEFTGGYDCTCEDQQHALKFARAKQALLDASRSKQKAASAIIRS